MSLLSLYCDKASFTLRELEKKNKVTLGLTMAKWDKMFSKCGTVSHFILTLSQFSYIVSINGTELNTSKIVQQL